MDFIKKNCKSFLLILAGTLDFILFAFAYAVA